jgi:hypothetical protein
MIKRPSLDHTHTHIAPRFRLIYDIWLPILRGPFITVTIAIILISIANSSSDNNNNIQLVLQVRQMSASFHWPPLRVSSAYVCGPPLSGQTRPLVRESHNGPKDEPRQRSHA